MSFVCFVKSSIIYSNDEINPFGVNVEKSKTIYFIESILFGKLSVEEAQGHIIHHKNSQIKPRFYSKILESK
jgi:hypothetical protein